MSWSSGWFCQYSSGSKTRADQRSVGSEPGSWAEETERSPREDLTEDEQQLLSPSQGEDRDQAAALPVHDVVDGVAETSLPLLTLLVDVSAIGRLLNAEQETLLSMLGSLIHHSCIKISSHMT